MFTYAFCPHCQRKEMIVSSTLTPAVAILHCGHAIGTDRVIAKAVAQ